MKCLSLHQPWATLILIGAHRYQSQLRPTRYRGLLAIHASLHICETAARLCNLEPIRQALRQAGYRFCADLPRGLLGTVELVDCLPADPLPADMGSLERLLRRPRSGRFLWRLANPVLFDAPRPSVGQPGFYNLPALSVGHDPQQPATDYGLRTKCHDSSQSHQRPSAGSSRRSGAA